ncbi:MAG: hypothetical protein LBJ16_03765 [Holosporaceae bacterium]|jgi:hypothetical protein|nr:hypothetical protein [Holosporaceae bacterium]
MIIGKKRFAIAIMLGLFAIGLGDQAEGYVKDTNGVLRCVDKEKNEAVLSAYKKYVAEREQSGGSANLSDPKNVREFLISLVERRKNIRDDGENEKAKKNLQLLEYIFMDGAGFGIKIEDTWNEDWANDMFGVIIGFGRRLVREGPGKLVNYFLNPPTNPEDKKVWECMTNTMARHGGRTGDAVCGAEAAYEGLQNDKRYGDGERENKGKFENAMKTKFSLASPDDDLKLIKSPIMYILSGEWNVNKFYEETGKASQHENTVAKMTKPLWQCSRDILENGHDYVQLKFATNLKSSCNGDAPVLDKRYQELLRMMRWARGVEENDGLHPVDENSGVITCRTLRLLNGLGNAIELEAIINYATMLRFWGIGFRQDTPKYWYGQYNYSDAYYVADKRAFLTAVTGHNRLRMSRVMQFLNIMGFYPLTEGLMNLLEKDGKDGNPKYKESLSYWRKASGHCPRIF